MNVLTHGQHPSECERVFFYRNSNIVSRRGNKSNIALRAKWTKERISAGGNIWRDTIQFRKSHWYLLLQKYDIMEYIYQLGIQIRNMKMDFNFYCTWRWVTLEKLMMKIYDFFFIRLSHLVGDPVLIILCKNHCEDGRFFTQYYMGWLNNLVE